MDEVNDVTPDISQSSTDDSGINVFLAGSRDDEENPTVSCSDVLAQLFQSHKKLKEAKTQVISLSLILEQDKTGESSVGVNLEVFQRNKNVLEEEIMRIKKDIYDKESFLQKSDLKLFKQYSDSFQDDDNKNDETKLDENDDIMHLNEEASLPHDTVEFITSDFTLEEKNHFGDKDEITKLRRALTETKQNHKKERDEITRQLKALQVTTVNGETNWRCIVREKQLKIDELTKKNADLQDKHEILNACENLKQKEAKENERKKRKDEKVITSLRKQNTSINKEIKQLQSEVKELTDFNQESKETMKRLLERNKELEKNLCDKNQTLNEKNKIVQEYSNEIKKTNTLVNKLIIETNIVNTEKNDLSEQLELRTNTLREEKLRFESLLNESDTKNKSCVHVGIQTEEYQMKDELGRLSAELMLEKEKNTNLLEILHKERVSIERLKKNEIELEKEWRNKSNENERTIQELTISLGKAMAENEFSCDRRLQENRKTKEQRLTDCWLETLEEINMELNRAQEDFRKHAENVESLHKNWREYKRSLLQINEELNSQKRKPDTTF